MRSWDSGSIQRNLRYYKLLHYEPLNLCVTAEIYSGQKNIYDQSPNSPCVNEDTVTVPFAVVCRQWAEKVLSKSHLVWDIFHYVPLCRNVTQILKPCKLVCSLSVQNIDFSKGQQCAQLLCKLIFILMVQGLTVNNALCSSSHCTRELLKRLDVRGGRVCNEAVLWMKLELCKDTHEHLSTRSFF